LIGWLGWLVVDAVSIVAELFWLVGRFDRLVDWLVGRLVVDWLVGRAVGWLVDTEFFQYLQQLNKNQDFQQPNVLPNKF